MACEEELKIIQKFHDDFPNTTINKKLELGQAMIKFLSSNPDITNQYEDIGNFVEGLGQHWVLSPNSRVSQYGLEALMLIAEAMQRRYSLYCQQVQAAAMSKFGASNDTQREKVRSYFVKTVEVGAQNANSLLIALGGMITSKNNHLAVEAMKTILDILTLCAVRPLDHQGLLELVKALIKVLPQSLLNADAHSAIVTIAGRVGKAKVLDTLTKHTKTYNAHELKKLQLVTNDIRGSQVAEFKGGNVGANNVVSHPSSTNSGAPPPPEDRYDEPDFTATHAPKPATAKRPVTSKIQQKSKNTFAGDSSKEKEMASRKYSQLGKGKAYCQTSGPSGEVDEAWFNEAFDDYHDIVCVNHKEYEMALKKISDDLKSGAEHWERKVDALRKIRGLVVNHRGSPHDEAILAMVKSLSLNLMQHLKDLRSQVVREMCLTFAFLCKEFKNKMDAHACEIIFHQLMNNVMSSAKVIANASYIALKFMLMNVFNGRLIVALSSELNNSKSKEVRQAAVEFFQLILQFWPVSRLETQIPLLQEGIKKGCAEGLPEARMAARKAYWMFRNHFPEQGEALLYSMDPLAKRNLMAGAVKDEVVTTRPRGGLALRQLPETPATMTTSGMRRCTTPQPNIRSNSAIDLQAAQRAKARQQYAALARQKVGSGASLPRSTKKEPVSGTFEAERPGRTRSRVAGVSHSQPSSRSGSPSSRLGYHTYNRAATPQRSQNTSRETSPNRFGSKTALNNLFGTKRRLVNERPPIQSSRPVLAQKMLQQSLEAENSEIPLYDGETDSSHKISPRKTSYRPFEDHSDDSDASSLCSERSFDSYRRTSDSFSWSGSQQRLYRDSWDQGIKDIGEIIANCESTHWGDRKEGLVALQNWLLAGNALNPTELKRVTEIFNRMFMDNHTKVFSLFLDTLNELLKVHKGDLNSWLYLLLTRLLNKLGADLLGSIQNKINKSLEVVRDSFPKDLQMSAVLRFLTDPTQTPNLRVKTAALGYVTKLCAVTDPAIAFPPHSYVLTDPPDVVGQALHRLIGWTMGDSIGQGTELRRAAQDAIVALFNLNTPQITLRLAHLPQEYQEAAGTMLRGRVRRGSSSSGGGTATNSPPSPTPRLSSPAPLRHSFSRPTPPQDSESLDPQEIYRSLRKTTAEIQSYTYEAGAVAGMGAGGDAPSPPDRDNTLSKDSGISQLSGTEEAMEEPSLHSSSSSNTTTSLTHRVLTVRDCNGMDVPDNTQAEDGAVDEEEAMRKIVDALRTPPDSDNGENISIVSESEKRASLNQLTRLIRDSSVTLLQDHFKALLRILLGNLAQDSVNRDVQTRMLVLNALMELIKKRAMTESLNHYIELLILKVLNSYKDPSKDVVRSAEACANTIATTLAPGMVIRVLAPLIQTGEYPLNLAAVKMLTKLVDACGRDPVYEFLPDLMPGLIQAYDNQESSVRKSAVFCMVALHTAIGEEDLKPHLVGLNGSKLKLLHLYIRRSQQGSSAPTSPRNHPPPPS